MKILVVEDNDKLCEDIVQFLNDNNFLAQAVSCFEDARQKLLIYEYDLAIIDLGLPDGNGLDLIEIIRSKNNTTGIIILTAKHSLEYKVKGLDLGADDYLTKPFHKAELNARIHSILRRRNANGNNIVIVDQIKIDTSAHQVSVKDKILNLTRKEYDLLLYFVYNKNRLLTKENIAEHLWGDHIDQADNFDFIYSHIKNLRAKISQAGGQKYIKSMYGMGYKFSSTD